MQTVVQNGVYFPFVDLLSSVATAIVLGYGGYLVFERRRLDRHARRVPRLPDELLRPGAAALAALQHVPLGGRGARQDHRRARRGAGGARRRRAPSTLARIRGHVRFDDVHFAYGSGPEVLHGIDLDVAAGTTVALVGHTGAGKSTIAKLIARFYDPTGGRDHDRRHRPARRHARSRCAASSGSSRRRASCSPARSPTTSPSAGPSATREEIVAAAARGRRRRVHRAARGRLRHGARRARLPPLARPAPARRVRPRAARRPADPDPRRGDELGRHRHRAQDRARAAPPAPRPHRVHHRAPPLDDPRRRPDRRARARPGRRAGHARRAARAAAGATPSSTATGPQVA